MKYLITGAAGFIGFHLSKNLLKNRNNKVYGLDNFDSYYSVKLKKQRIKLLKRNKNFNLIHADLSDKSQLKKIKNLKIDIIFHFAAQAGVRYTLKNPKKYVKTNIFGFYNLMSFVENSNVKYIFYASSSSIYGDNKNYPLDEKAKPIPKNIYAYSKISNENCSKFFSKLFKKKFIGLRFFTVYGEWGRPDMLIYKYLDFARKKKVFFVNNYGKDFRDFTYIEDVISIISLLIKKRNKLPLDDVFNICSNKPIKTKKVIELLSNNFHGKIKYLPQNRIEMLKTHGDNKKVLKFTKFKKISNFDEKFDHCVKWFKNNKSLFD